MFYEDINVNVLFGFRQPKKYKCFKRSNFKLKIKIRFKKKIMNAREEFMCKKFIKGDS